MNTLCFFAKWIWDNILWKKGNKGYQQNEEQILPLLYFLLPLSGILLLWRKRDILSRIFVNVDRSLAAMRPSLSKRQQFLIWVSNQLPSTWSSQLVTFPGGFLELWKDGSLLCALVNSAVPGACPNPHRHWRKPPSHGQAIAFKYLGVKPVFTENDFIETILSVPQEEKFISYLCRLQQAIIKLNSTSTLHFQTTTCSPHYIARGMGLVTGTQNQNTTFYIYSTSKSSLIKDVIVKIRGPYSSNTTIIVPAFHNSSLKQMSYENKNRRKISFLKSIVSGERCNNYTIPVKIVMEYDRAVVEFVPKYTGMYQVILLSNNEHLAGSPYNIRVLEDNYDENRTNIDDDLEFRFTKRTKQIVIPHCGYQFKSNECYGMSGINITEKKQIYGHKVNANHKFLHIHEDVTTTTTNLNPAEIKQSKTKQKMSDLFINKTTPNNQKTIEGRKQINLDMVKKTTKQNTAIVPPEKFISTICEKHIVRKGYSVDDEVELSTFSVKENVVVKSNEIPKPIKAFIQQKNNDWDHITQANIKEVTLNFKSTATSNNSFSNEVLNKKIDFDFSWDKSVDGIDIPSVQERKSVLVKHLTDEQKLLQIQNEKKIMNSQNNRKIKPKRWDSLNLAFTKDNENLQSNFKYARNYFHNLEQDLIRNNGLDKKNAKYTASMKQSRETFTNYDFLYEDMVGNRKNPPNRVCMDSLVFYLKSRKRAKKDFMSLFNLNIKR